MNILVLGKNGMVGHVVYHALSSHTSWNVVGTQRDDPYGPHYFDAEDMDGVERFFASNQYDYVINCIGAQSTLVDSKDPSSLERAIFVNSVFPHVLARVTEHSKSRIVHISTDGVFSGVSAAAYFEDSPTDAHTPYGKMKALGESSTPHVLNTRCSFVGSDPFHHRSLFEWFLGLQEGAVITGYRKFLWNGVSTLQFARLCETLISRDIFYITRNESSVHHFCPNEEISRYDLLTIFKKITGKKILIEDHSDEERDYSFVLHTRYGSLNSIVAGKKNWTEIMEEVWLHREEF